MKLGDTRVYHSTVTKIPCGVIREGDYISLIIIDGYNLIGISHADLGAEREKLIRALSEYRKKKGHDITVVFDGWKSGGRTAESRTIGGIKVIYTRLGDTADSQIKEIVRSGKEEWIVVTSDRDIAAFVWGSGSVPVESDKFLRSFDSAAGSLSGDEDRSRENDAYEGRERKRGSPRTLSRKEKALMRVLKKL
ncbi:MAG: NYN domain-containing protein [Nitrospiraceae bacterium]|nr:NYN domain-containing protein [Nitrospiraceae bacterium]